MKYIDYYNKILQYMKEFKRKNYFEKLSFPSFLLLSDGKTKVLITFDTLMRNNISKIDFYFDDNIAYYLDTMVLETDLLIDTPYQSKSSILIKDQSVLTTDDSAFLKKHNIKKVKKYNFFTYDYKEGELNCSMKTLKLKKILKFIEFLSDLINNEEQYILDSFTNNKIVMANFNYNEKLYDIFSSEFIQFDKYKNLQFLDLLFVDNFKDSYYCNDTCYISKFYDYELTDDSKYFKPIIFIYYENSNKAIYKKFDFKYEDVIHHLKDYISDIFEKEGLPTNVIVNDNYVFNELYITFTNLQIEMKFQRENHQNQKKFLEKFNEEKNNYSSIDDNNDYLYAVVNYKKKFNDLYDNIILPENRDKDLELDSSLVS